MNIQRHRILGSSLPRWDSVPATSSSPPAAPGQAPAPIAVSRSSRHYADACTKANIPAATKLPRLRDPRRFRCLRSTSQSEQVANDYPSQGVKAQPAPGDSVPVAYGLHQQHRGRCISMLRRNKAYALVGKLRCLLFRKWALSPVPGILQAASASVPGSESHNDCPHERHGDADYERNSQPRPGRPPEARRAELPFWPRRLSREQAAAYCGISATLLDQIVKASAYPADPRDEPEGTEARADALRPARTRHCP